MPFTTLAHGESAAGASRRASAERYLDTQPEPLVTAILDGDMEREGRTTGILVYGFVYDHKASGARIHVPENFITDFASIPSVVQGVFPPFGRHAKAAVLHDWLYAVGEPGQKDFADRIFLDAMTELVVPKARRDVMYQAVSLFGGDGYRRAAKDWAISWGDWRKGEYLPPNQRPKREDFFRANWPKAPKASFRP